MARNSTSDALERWRDAEAKYTRTIEMYLDVDDPAKIDRNAALRVTEARVKADKRREDYFHRCLDDHS